MRIVPSHVHHFSVDNFASQSTVRIAEVVSVACAGNELSTAKEFMRIAHSSVHSLFVEVRSVLFGLHV